MGFFGPVCKLIVECVETSWFYVIMNGTYKEFFKSNWRLRQGDPLSPYLFILMEEVFSLLLQVEFESGWIGKFYHFWSCPLVSHLLYTNDLLVFTNGAQGSLKQLLKTL